ncbi:NAD-binding Rossmann fold oxidoreductase family protein [Paecilomyces variotii No. 5]|uniref:NAD-binding Rossmann fold oxidoreductase family protein n=1 Tax=Byssochlamys spectabilis (strain No. 5 / NBRC 109023) TaxID=1356009 RepID=V5F7H8_BYSSN|nr:NAD-binding Rossmann fold oxidoreductase family protein [Paecilomyces variotii No. 5]
MTTRKLRVGVAGLGRMGKRHAINFHELTARADVVAASTPDESERVWAAENLKGVQIYADYDEMLEKTDLEAVVVASITAVHAEQTLKAITKGLHVLCEKPLSIDVEVAQSVVSAYEESLKTYPQQKVVCGFSRRFDASYREAYERITKDEFGSPVLFRSQTADLYDTSGFFVEYAKTSGGIFVDCSIHDIDLMLWFLGEDRKLKSLQAVGVAAVHPALEASHDRDNAIATVEFEGGKIAALYCSRMMAAGQEDTTEIICSKGSVRVNMQVRKNHVEIHDSLGARRELPQHYYERFREAFITEAYEFTACCLDNTSPPISLQSSVKAVGIGQALQRSLISGEKVFFDERATKN